MPVAIPDPLHAGALRLAPWQAHHAGALYTAVAESRASLGAWLAWCRPGYTRADAAAWIAHCAEARGRGSEFAFAILDAGGGLLGGVGINALDDARASANLGYWLRDTARGRGVATRAAQCLADWAFSALALETIEIVVALDNAASRRCAERIGARATGTQAARIALGTRRLDAVVHLLTAADLAAARAAAEISGRA